MRVVFLFPPTNERDALVNWIDMLALHQKKHTVHHAIDLIACADADCVFLLTESVSYLAKRINDDIDCLRSRSVPFGVVHNHDDPAVPRPGRYPSFCWTKRAQANLREYNPVYLVRQPGFPPVVPFRQRSLCLGTLGHVEPKKCIWTMARWARIVGLPLVIHAPDTFVELYRLYIDHVKHWDATIVVHPWVKDISQLAPQLDEISHFLFVLPRSKMGTGGSPTSPRYATAFNRPVLVIDDEDALSADGFYVYASLRDIDPATLVGMQPPHLWLPHQYIDELVHKTMRFWNKL